MQNEGSAIVRQLRDGVAYNNSQRVGRSGLQSDKQLLWLCLTLLEKQRFGHMCAWFGPVLVFFH